MVILDFYSIPAAVDNASENTPELSSNNTDTYVNENAGMFEETVKSKAQRPKSANKQSK